MRLYNKLEILNHHLEKGTVHDCNQMSPSYKKELILKGDLINVFNRDNLNSVGYTVLTEKGFKKIMKYRKLFLIWGLFKKVKRIYKHV
jgi:hypothetical protein